LTAIIKLSAEGIGDSFERIRRSAFPFVFNGNQHRKISRGASPLFPRSLAANIGLIYFYGATGKTFLSTGAHFMASAAVYEAK
jgi:hypothetical protein